MCRESLKILPFNLSTGHLHPNLRTVFENYLGFLTKMALSGDEISKRVWALGTEAGFDVEGYRRVLERWSLTGDFRHHRGEMLRIIQCVSAQGAVKYFDVALCRSDYYTAGAWRLGRKSGRTPARSKSPKIKNFLNMQFPREMAQLEKTRSK